jgi:hypothetical protein
VTVISTPICKILSSVEQLVLGGSGAGSNSEFEIIVEIAEFQDFYKFGLRLLKIYST